MSEEVEAVSADGVYDKRKCYKAIEERGAKANIPPRIDAQYWSQEGEDHARNRMTHLGMPDSYALES